MSQSLFVCMLLNDFMYCNLLFAYSYIVSSITIWHYSSIWPIDGALTDTTNLGQSVPRSNGNEEVLYITQSSKTGATPSDNLLSLTGYSLGVPVEGQSAYSIDPADRFNIF